MDKVKMVVFVGLVVFFSYNFNTYLRLVRLVRYFQADNSLGELSEPVVEACVQEQKKSNLILLIL